MVLFILSHILLQPVPVSARAQASARGRIIRPAAASQDEWAKASSAQRREVVIREKDGRETLVRLIEYQ